MSADESNDEVARLVDLLEEAAILLERYGETQWARWLSASRYEVSARDGHGLVRLLGAYGGMGSFNDLLIAAANGHPIQRADEHRANERLSSLRSEIWRLASDLHRNVEGPGT